MKMRDRPNKMTRNPGKKIVELGKLMRSDTRISTQLMEVLVRSDIMSSR